MMNNVEEDHVRKALRIVPLGLVPWGSWVALARCVSDELWDWKPSESVGGEEMETTSVAALVKLGCGFPLQPL